MPDQDVKQSHFPSVRSRKCLSKKAPKRKKRLALFKRTSLNSADLNEAHDSGHLLPDISPGSPFKAVSEAGGSSGLKLINSEVQTKSIPPEDVDLIDETHSSYSHNNCQFHISTTPNRQNLNFKMCDGSPKHSITYLSDSSEVSNCHLSACVPLQISVKRSLDAIEAGCFSIDAFNARQSTSVENSHSDDHKNIAIESHDEDTMSVSEEERSGVEFKPTQNMLVKDLDKCVGTDFHYADMSKSSSISRAVTSCKKLLQGILEDLGVFDTEIKSYSICPDVSCGLSDASDLMAVSSTIIESKKMPSEINLWMESNEPEQTELESLFTYLHEPGKTKCDNSTGSSLSQSVKAAMIERIGGMLHGIEPLTNVCVTLLKLWHRRTRGTINLSTDSDPLEGALRLLHDKVYLIMEVLAELDNQQILLLDREELRCIWLLHDATVCGLQAYCSLHDQRREESLHFTSHALFMMSMKVLIPSSEWTVADTVSSLTKLCALQSRLVDANIFHPVCQCREILFSLNQERSCEVCHFNFIYENLCEKTGQPDINGPLLSNDKLSSDMSTLQHMLPRINLFLHKLDHINDEELSAKFHSHKKSQLICHPDSGFCLCSIHRSGPFCKCFYSWSKSDRTELNLRRNLIRKSCESETPDGLVIGGNTRSKENQCFSKNAIKDEGIEDSYDEAVECLRITSSDEDVPATSDPSGFFLSDDNLCLNGSMRGCNAEQLIPAAGHTDFKTECDLRISNTFSLKDCSYWQKSFRQNIENISCNADDAESHPSESSSRRSTLTTHDTFDEQPCQEKIAEPVLSQCIVGGEVGKEVAKVKKDDLSLEDEQSSLHRDIREKGNYGSVISHSQSPRKETSDYRCEASSMPAVMKRHAGKMRDSPGNPRFSRKAVTFREPMVEAVYENSYNMIKDPTDAVKISSSTKEMVNSAGGYEKIGSSTSLLSDEEISKEKREHGNNPRKEKVDHESAYDRIISQSVPVINLNAIVTPAVKEKDVNQSSLVASRTEPNQKYHLAVSKGDLCGRSKKSLALKGSPLFSKAKGKSTWTKIKCDQECRAKKSSFEVELKEKSRHNKDFVQVESGSESLKSCEKSMKTSKIVNVTPKIYKAIDENVEVFPVSNGLKEKTVKQLPEIDFNPTVCDGIQMSDLLHEDNETPDGLSQADLSTESCFEVYKEKNGSKKRREKNSSSVTKSVKRKGNTNMHLITAKGDGPKRGCASHLNQQQMLGNLVAMDSESNKATTKRRTKNSDTKPKSMARIAMLTDENHKGDVQEELEGMLVSSNDVCSTRPCELKSGVTTHQRIPDKLGRLPKGVSYKNKLQCHETWNRKNDEWKEYLKSLQSRLFPEA